MLFNAEASLPTSSFDSTASRVSKTPYSMLFAISAAFRIGRAILADIRHRNRLASRMMPMPAPICSRVAKMERAFTSLFRLLTSASATSFGTWIRTAHGLPVLPSGIGAMALMDCEASSTQVFALPALMSSSSAAACCSPAPDVNGLPMLSGLALSATTSPRSLRISSRPLPSYRDLLVSWLIFCTKSRL